MCVCVFCVFACFLFLFLSSKVEYPLPWVESHVSAITDQVNRLSKILDVYTDRLDDGANFRSSLLKKEPLLQYVATNLHIQVCIA